MNDNLIKCPYCDEEIDRDSVRCEYCAESIKKDYVIVNNPLINNSYNILGLDTSSNQKQISKRAKDVLKYLAIGEVPDYENDLYFTHEYRNEIYVKSALDSLTNPKEKILNTFFWFDIENDDDKNIFSIYNTKNYNNAIDLFKKSNNKKNLAILYTLLLLDPSINSDYSEYVENSLTLFKEIQDDDKFWKMFEKKYLLFDDISTNKDLISEFRKDLGKHLSNIFYDISTKLGDDSILKKFHKYFKNTKGNKTNEQVEKIYLDLGKLSRELEEMNISEDGVFDDDEKAKVKKIHYDITQLLRKLEDLGLYDDSKTLIIRDTVAEAFRTIMLDLNNELNEEDEALKVLNYAIDIVGTDGLKHKINEDYKTITANIKLKPIIQLLDDEDFIGASKKIEELENKKFNKEDQIYLKNLKKRAVFGLLGKIFLNGKEEFESENYPKAIKYFNKVEELAKNNIELFEGINPEGLDNILNNIRAYLSKVETGKLNAKEVFDHIDTIRADALEKLSEEDGYFFIFYVDSITYGALSRFIINKKNNNGWSGWVGLICLILTGIFILISVFSDDASNNSNYSSSSNNYSSSNTYTNDTDYTNDDINTLFSNNSTDSNSNKCILNGIEYTKPEHAYCVPEDNYNAWKCDIGYHEKDNYCWCTSGDYTCPISLDTSSLDKQINSLQLEIDNMYVNQYSDNSVNRYNAKVDSMNNLIEERNKKLNESCSCN
ncbi:hypothetical protein [Candidatus Vampirococcus lugosii]|uniref:Thyroglobulin type-1 domain-containing protein n=1 Tax=Candidatus Vampirococcus lugosii TaxID=2789015 RepID=A0ABS5QLW6_9BACT|nr:hypothetical protein [Candidatus Vampirococcus lugosii]MBS8122195.1 hypothetical protein [Candidatus Vampirococcus lugosii]